MACDAASHPSPPFLVAPFQTTLPDLILQNGRVTILDVQKPQARELVIKDGSIVGVDNAAQFPRGLAILVIDLGGRRVIPGLNDSHLHVIRGGLHYNLKLRWDGVPTLADGLRMLREQAARTSTSQRRSPSRSARTLHAGLK